MLTALGAIRVARCHGYCQRCRQPEFAADRLLGVDDWLTARARRMTCLAGINDPFRKAEQLLAELAGWSVAAETIRRRCHQTAADARRQQSQRQALPQEFTQAAGDRELHIDAGKVNTPDGWRDVKVAVFACRTRGAATADYEQRQLPAPTARALVAEVEEAQAFGARCQTEAQRLGVSATGLSVLGDGADWIWKVAARRFAEAEQLLDIYHGVEHLAAAARPALGEGDVLKAWLDEARQRLLGDGYWGVCEVLAQPLADADQQSRLAASAGAVLNYFCGHRDRLGYAVRLRRGQVIGSGLVEGAIKQRINVRLKGGSVRWLAEQVGPFVELVALADSAEWSEYWAMLAC